MSKRRPMRDFPRSYKLKAERLLLETATEFRSYMLAMVETAECKMPDRKYFRTPEEVMAFALETTAQRLYEKLRDQREANSGVDDLLEDLGINKQ